MAQPALHRFEREGRHYVIDPETCFCFECDAISRDVLELYPHTPVNRIYHLLQERYTLQELHEVVGELEWLRSAKSILLPPTDTAKDLKVEQGLCALVVELPGAPSAPTRGWSRKTAGPGWSLDIARLAAPFLLARSQHQKKLRLEFLLKAPPPDPAALSALLEDALRLGRACGKELQVVLHLQDLQAVVTQEIFPSSVSRSPEHASSEDAETLPHRLSLRLTLPASGSPQGTIAKLSGLWTAPLSKLAKLAVDLTGEEPPQFVAHPQHPHFGGVVQALDQAGLKSIQIEVASLFAQAQAPHALEAITGSLEQNARYYVARLLEHHYFRVEPFAALFLQIHHGTPVLRRDPAGTQALALSAAGEVYPSTQFLDRPEFCLGSLPEGRLDEQQIRSFENVGALTTAGCINCWARSLCGGGHTAIHHAMSGSIRQPHAGWCASQRAWLESAIAAFNQLASAGINFERLHQNLNQAKRPSLFTLAKAAFRMQLGIRPIEEADAPWLRRWENWNTAAYFSAVENSVLMATQYDREMDALHPRALERELVLVKRDGSPIGLLRLRPDPLEGTARLWIYFRNPADYANEGYRRSLGDILKEAGTQQAFRRVLCPEGPSDAGLAGLLHGLGFELLGTEREALYLHGTYHDVQVHGYSVPV